MDYIHTMCVYDIYVCMYVCMYVYMYVCMYTNVCIYTNSVSYYYQAITKAMKTNKIDKPGKVYVVTKQTGGGGSMGNMTSSGKNKVQYPRKLLY